MARPGLSRAQDQVNILLKFPLEQQVGSDIIAALTDPDRGVRREALARIEIYEPDYRQHAEDVVRRIVDRLAPVAPSLGVTAEASGASYLSIDDLDPNVGPPEGVPIYNPYTGVLSVYPDYGVTAEDAVQSIETAVKDDDEVEGVEPVAIYRAIAALDANLQTIPEISGFNDAGFGMEEVEFRDDDASLLAETTGEHIPWGIDQIGARAAWRRGYTGQGVFVAVVDTGISPHMDLAEPVRGATLIPGSNSYNDDHGHGTHVAGTIAALKENSRGVVGVAPGARLLAVKVLARDGFSRGDSVAHGVTWAANNGARVINLSLGSRADSDSLRRAVVYARSRNVIICAAAGNDYGAPVSYPAAFDDACIAVAATDRANRRAPFSNRGRQVDLSAPGVLIRSTHLANGYREMNGTSMATPHVSGVAAIVLSQHPDLTPLALQRHLEATATRLGAPDQYGRGLVHAERAVARSVSSATSDIGVPPQPLGGTAVAAIRSRGRRSGARSEKSMGAENV
ncbi:S8 family peptidase [Sinorhizobium medicae]|nr:S8 family peptidase [Sinorhizobium medicae]